MPWFGPTLLAVRPFRDAAESFDATMEALQGVPLAARPDLWQPYAAARARVLEVAKPAEQLKHRFPGRSAEIDAALKRAGGDPATALYVPMAGRKFFWTVFLDPQNAQVLTFLPLDSF